MISYENTKFSLLCDVIFLVRLQGKFDFDHSWEWLTKIIFLEKFLWPNIMFYLSCKDPVQFGQWVRLHKMQLPRAEWKHLPTQKNSTETTSQPGLFTRPSATLRKAQSRHNAWRHLPRQKPMLRWKSSRIVRGIGVNGSQISQKRRKMQRLRTGCKPWPMQNPRIEIIKRGGVSYGRCPSQPRRHCHHSVSNNLPAQRVEASITRITIQMRGRFLLGQKLPSRHHGLMNCPCPFHGKFEPRRLPELAKMYQAMETRD